MNSPDDTQLAMRVRARTVYEGYGLPRRSEL